MRFNLGYGSCGLLNLRVSVAKLSAATLRNHLPLPTLSVAESHLPLPTLAEEAQLLSSGQASEPPTPTSAESHLRTSTLVCSPRILAQGISSASYELNVSSDLSCPPISPLREAAIACDRSGTKRSASPQPPPAAMTHLADGGGDGRPGSPPSPVKKVKLEYASSAGSPRDERSKVGLQSDLKKIDSDRVESAVGNSSLPAALLLKRENSAEEAKFDIHDKSSLATAEAKAMLSPASNELLMSAKAEDMKAEIAQIDSILRNRLLLKETVTSHANSYDLKKEGEADIPKAFFQLFAFTFLRCLIITGIVGFKIKSRLFHLITIYATYRYRMRH
jgi:hypothetical protein